MAEQLTPAEDEQLRRLAALAEFGRLTPEAMAVFEELRGRDRRREIREPRILAIPVQRPARDAQPWVSV
jgi:hypothetical protein